MKVSIENNGKEVISTEASAANSAIKVGLEQLRYYKKVGSSNDDKELDWEIKLYEWMLAQENSEELAEKYVRARFPDPTQGLIVPKREVVRQLGWDVK